MMCGEGGVYVMLKRSCRSGDRGGKGGLHHDMTKEGRGHARGGKGKSTKKTHIQYLGRRKKKGCLSVCLFVRLCFSTQHTLHPAKKGEG